MSKSSLVNVEVPAYSGNFSNGRSGRKIEAITIHHMAGVLTGEQCGKIFQNANRKASSNYGIGKNADVALYVDEENTSYCNSNWDSNCKSVTIEVSNSSTGGDWLVSDKVLKKLIELVADIAKRNNLGKLVKGKNLTWHSMFTSTTCPGKYLLSKMDYIVEEVNKINDMNQNFFEGVSDEELAKRVWTGEFGNGDERKQKLGSRYSTVQALVDKGVGKPTSNNIQSTTSKPQIDILTLVKKTIRGDFGNGEARKKALGSNYDEVQKQVNLNYKNGTTRWDNIRLY